MKILGNKTYSNLNTWRIVDDMDDELKIEFYDGVTKQTKIIQIATAIFFACFISFIIYKEAKLVMVIMSIVIFVFTSIVIYFMGNLGLSSAKEIGDLIIVNIKEKSLYIGVERKVYNFNEVKRICSVSGKFGCSIVTELQVELLDGRIICAAWSIFSNDVYKKFMTALARKSNIKAYRYELGFLGKSNSFLYQ